MSLNFKVGFLKAVSSILCPHKARVFMLMIMGMVNLFYNLQKQKYFMAYFSYIG